MKLKIKKYDEYDFRAKPTLESSLWEGDQLNVEVHDALLKIAEEFIVFLRLGLDIESAKDIQITGSLANYNYTKYSDLDLHILLDFDEIDENSILVKEYLMSKKVIWNNNYSIKVKNWEVEVYPQDIKEEHHSTGIYSILNNQWIKEPEVPKKLWTSMRLSDIKKKVKEIKYEIDNIEASEDPEGVISRLKDKIKNMRRAGLEQDGEYSIENLTFKALRRLGDVDRLYSLGKKEYEKSLSLNGGCVTQEQLYEDVVGILQEDTEWWKKRRQTDKKNLRVLIGDIPGAKGKHVKSGAPFTNDPPHHPGNKLGPGLGLLEEEIQEEDFLNSLKNSSPGDSLAFSVLRVVKGGPLDMFDVFVPGKQYLAVITNDNKINFKNTEKGSQTQTKEEVIQKLSSEGPICKTVDCNSAQLTGAGQPVAPKQTQIGTTKKPTAISKDTPISDDKQKNIAQRLSKKYIPEASKGTLDKIGDWFSNNPYIKTAGELLSNLWDFFKNMFSGFSLGAALGLSDDKEKEITTDQQTDLKLSYRQIRDKFKGYKGESTGFKGYIHFLWDEFDKNKKTAFIQGWTKKDTETLVKQLAPKYKLEPYIIMGVMSGESGGMPVGIHGQTKARAGSPKIAIRANSTAYGSGQVTQTTYEKIKNQVGVPHYMLWNPKYGIEATIATVANKIKTRGNLAAAMRSYAGTEAGGRRKMAAIAAAKKQYA
jgi:hypothetical protein